jgi:hypothetical protein
MLHLTETKGNSSMRKAVALLSIAALMGLTGCSELKLSNNKVPEYGAGQEGHDITHQVTERHWENQAGATGPAVSEVNSGTVPNAGKPNAEAGAVTAVENTATQEITGAKPNSANGVPQEKH